MYFIVISYPPYTPERDVALWLVCVNVVDATVSCCLIFLRQTEMAKFLVQCGADISKVSHRGYTAFDFASEMLDTDIMRIFIEAQVSLLCITKVHHLIVCYFVFSRINSCKPLQFTFLLHNTILYIYVSGGLSMPVQYENVLYEWCCYWLPFLLLYSFRYY